MQFAIAVFGTYTVTTNSVYHQKESYFYGCLRLSTGSPATTTRSTLVRLPKRLKTKLKEHRDAHRKGNMEISAVAEHTWNTQVRGYYQCCPG